MNNDTVPEELRHPRGYSSSADYAPWRHPKYYSSTTSPNRASSHCLPPRALLASPHRLHLRRIPRT